MGKDEDGKLKYIHGIPYLTSKDIKIEPRGAVDDAFGRILLGLFKGWRGTVVLFLLLMLGVTIGAVLIDYLIAMALR